MFKFFLKRLLFSVAIISGVMLLTFALFNVAAGDPAAALLGKNATPEELENLRIKLGSDLPVLFGFYRKSEAIAVPTLPVELEKNVPLNLKRNFEAKMPLYVKVKFNGILNGQKNDSANAIYIADMFLNSKVICLNTYVL